MAKIEQATEEQWRAIASQAMVCRKELLKLHKLVASHVPIPVANEIARAMDRVDSFRSKAEDEMFKRGGSQEIKIFYPDE